MENQKSYRKRRQYFTILVAMRNPESLKHKVGIGLKNNNKKKWLSTKRKITGEKKEFEQISKNRPGVCSVCEIIFKAEKTWHFAHWLPKWHYPKQRLNPNNIFLVCSIRCHYLLDKRFVGHKRQVLEILEAGWTWEDVLAYLDAQNG